MEFDLVRKLCSRGYLCVHVWHSGERAYGIARADIVCVKNGRGIVIECKYRENIEHIYVKRRQIQELQLIKNLITPHVYLCIKFGILDWLCVDPFKPDKITRSFYIFYKDSILRYGIPIEAL